MPANLQALCEDCHIEKTTAERSQSANQTCRRCNTVYSLYFGHTCPPCKAVVR